MAATASPRRRRTVFFLAVFFFFFFFFFLSGAGAADDNTSSPAILLTVCGKEQTQNPQGFDVNFVNAMEIVFQNITTHGFGVSVSGAGTDTAVYGLGQCFGYLSPVSCQLCYAQSRVKLPHCLPSSYARIYLDGCFLSYSNTNVSSDALDVFDEMLCSNSSTVDDDDDPSAGSVFAQAAGGLVGRLTGGAADAAGYYAAGSAAVSPELTVYGVAQCWRTLNVSGCRECLASANKTLSTCLFRPATAPAAEGRAMNAGCFVRYSTQPFYLSPATGGGGGGSSSRRLGVALGCVFAALLVIFIAIFVVKRRRAARDVGNCADDEDGSREYIRSISSSHLSFKYEDLRSATDEFNQINKIGQGGYGTVYKGVLRDGREVAVKRLFFNTRQRVDLFFNEVALISQVQHKNLVKLLGCSVEGPESLLVYEYLPNTSLDRFLFDPFKKVALDWATRLEVIVGTAEGLAYLHGASEVRIIHRDIKASNILLDDRFRAKIADFGLARNLADDRSHLSTGLAGTFGYMAPEYIVHGQLTEKADVYSYGVLVAEIITGRKNQSSMAASSDGNSLTTVVWRHFVGGALSELIDRSLLIRGEFVEEEAAVRVLHVGLLCMQASPALRPPMWKVVELLQIAGKSSSSRKELPVPSEPPFLNVRGGGGGGTSSSGVGSDGSSVSFAGGSSSSNHKSSSYTAAAAASMNHMSSSFVHGR